MDVALTTIQDLNFLPELLQPSTRLQINEKLRQEMLEQRETERSAQLQMILDVNPDLYFHLNSRGVITRFVNEKN